MHSLINMDNESMYDDFANISTGENTVSKDGLLKILQTYSGTISVFDLMEVTNELIEDTKYVQGEYREKANAIYIKYFLGRIKNIRDDNTQYNANIDKNKRRTLQ